MDKCSDQSSCTNTNNIKDFVKVALKQLWDLWNARFGLWPHFSSHSLTWAWFPNVVPSLPKPEASTHTVCAQAGRGSPVGRAQSLLSGPREGCCCCQVSSVSHQGVTALQHGQELLIPALLLLGLTWPAPGSCPPSLNSTSTGLAQDWVGLHLLKILRKFKHDLGICFFLFSISMWCFCACTPGLSLHTCSQSKCP